MRYFLRTLKLAWVYRVRLICSLVCALFAAIFWSVNFTAIYPTLKILGSKQNLQEWVNTSITSVQDEQIPRIQKDVDDIKALIANTKEKPDANREKNVRNFNFHLAQAQSKLENAQRELSNLLRAKPHIDNWFPTDRFRTLAMVMGLVLLAVAIKGVFEFAQESLVGSVVNLVLFDIRNLFFRQAIKMDVAQFGEHGTHELMSRFTNDTEMMGTGLKTLFGRVVAEPLRALACIVVACFINWQLTFMFLVLVPISLYILTRVGKLMKRATRRLLERMSSIYQILQESFTGIRIIKAFCQEPQRRRKFREATRDYYRKAMLVVNLDALAGPIIEVLGVTAIAAALLAGAYLVLNPGETKLFGIPMCDGPMEMESLLQLYALLAAIADPVRKLSSVFTKIQSGAAASDRVFRYIDREVHITSAPLSDTLPRHEKAVEFHNICFSYDPGHPILTGVNLRVEHGQIVAIVGKNGCGKSTLLNLLPRFYDPDHGSITVDGQDVRAINLRSLRRQIGIVTQETFLFADTIRNNIAFGRPRSSLDDIQEAARKAQAHDFIVKLPYGYDTKLGEAGLKISVGQRQKLCLARAILADPSILLLDEFTSAADAESEMEIHRVLREFMKRRTCFVITHRLNTLEMADRIVVIDGGKVAAEGSHGELMRISPLYERLYEAHFQRKAA